MKFGGIHLSVVILEAAGIGIVGGGIVVELIEHAPIGFVLITIGSAVVATGGFLWAKMGLFRGT